MKVWEGKEMQNFAFFVWYYIIYLYFILSFNNIWFNFEENSHTKCVQFYLFNDMLINEIIKIHHKLSNSLIKFI